MGFFDVLRASTSEPVPSANRGTTAARDAQKLQNLIEALRRRDERVLLSSDIVPKTISSGNQSLAAEAFAECVQCQGNLAVASFLNGSFGGGSSSSGLNEKVIQGISRQLVNAGLSANAIYNGEPLIFAAIDGNGSTNEFYTGLLIDHGASLTTTNKGGYSPLGAHLKHGSGSIHYRFKPYIVHGARLNDKDLTDFEIYKNIFQGGLYDIAKTIPKTKLSQFAKESDRATGLTLLHYAAGGMQVDVGRSHQDLFLKDYLSNDGYPALVNLLLECGADPNIKSNAGYSPASIALSYGHNEIYNILNKQASNSSSSTSSAINEPIDGMGTALFNACLLGDAAEVRALLAKGADPNVRSFANFPESELFNPSIPQRVGAFLLQQSLASMMSPTFFHHEEYGITNLYYPAMDGNVDIVCALLEAGADPNAPCLNGLFPLYVAAETGSLAVVEELVKHGADVNKPSPKGCTPILNAADEGRVEIVRYLLEHGADPYIRDKTGVNAIDTALKAGHVQVAQIMRDYR